MLALEEDIIKYINLFYNSPEDEHSFTEILGRMEGDDATPADEEDVGDAVSDSDSVIMQLVN